MDDETLDRVIKDAYISNAVGEKSVKFFVDRKLVEKDSAMRVQDVPNIQLVIVRE